MVLSALALVVVGVAQGDTGLVREHLYCTDKVQPFFFSQKRDRVARGFTPKAVIQALRGVHRKTWGLLIVEWAQTSPTLPNPLELGVLRDHRDNVGRLSYPSDVFIENAHSALTLPGVSDGRIRSCVRAGMKPHQLAGFAPAPLSHAPGQSPRGLRASRSQT